MRHNPYYGYRKWIGPDISRYLRQGAAYSNEDFDLTSMLANVLTDQDRGRGLSVPSGVHSKEFRAGYQAHSPYAQTEYSRQPEPVAS